MNDIRLVVADHPTVLDDARLLLREIALDLPAAFGEGAPAARIEELPGDYRAPGGLMLVAYFEEEPVGCAAFRALVDVDYPDACELRRLYVRPAVRRFGIGRVLATALIDHAREGGYSTMLLDTFNDTEAARGLYSSLGFEAIAPYYFSPQGGSHFLKVDIDDLVSRY